MPNNTARVTPSKTYGRGTGGVGDPRPTRWGGRGRRSSRNKSASLIGTFGLTVKLGFSIGDSSLPILPDRHILSETNPRREAMRALVGTTTFHPSLAEFTVVEPD